MNTEKAREVRDLLDDIKSLDIILNYWAKNDLTAMVKKLSELSQGPYYATNYYKDARELLKKHREKLGEELNEIRNRLNEKLLNEY